MSDSLRPHGLYSPWKSPDQNTGVGSVPLLQGIFPTQGSNPGLPHCRRILYQLSHKGSPRILEWVTYPFSSRSSWPRIGTRVSFIAGRFFTNCAIRKLEDTVQYITVNLNVTQNRGGFLFSSLCTNKGSGSLWRLLATCSPLCDWFLSAEKGSVPFSSRQASTVWHLWGLTLGLMPFWKYWINFEQEVLHFCFSPGLTNYVPGPVFHTLVWKKMTYDNMVVLQLARSWPVRPGQTRQAEALEEAARQKVTASLGN